MIRRFQRNLGPSRRSQDFAAANISLSVAGKTATASSSQGSGNTPDKAIDGNIGTWWSAGGPAPGWWQIDLGDVFTVTKIVWTNSNSSYVYIGNMQGSYGGVTWTNLFPFNTTGLATITFGGGWSTRFIRWNVTSSSGGYMGWLSIAEFEVWGH